MRKEKREIKFDSLFVMNYLFTDAAASANAPVDNHEDTTEIFRQPEDEVPAAQTR